MADPTHHDAAHDEARARARTFVRWTVVNVLLTTLACGLAMLIWLKEGELRRQLVRVLARAEKGCVSETRVIEGKKALIVDERELAPPQDQLRSGYISNYGTQISEAMMVRLEAIRDPGKPAVEVRLGAQEVLPSKAIHVVNLWATWCGPCKAEMPDFKDMFERRAAEWGAAVRFVPIQLEDSTDPRKSYGDFAALMPPTPVKLADRSYDKRLVTVFEADDKRKLYRGNLPVTFVLDCNRRVRWAKFEQLTEADFKELEDYLDKFRAELADTDPSAWCRKSWPGNGRCEGKENSPEDCGEPKRRGAAEEALLPPEPPPAAAVACPSGQTATADGRCVTRLKGAPVPSVAKPDSDAPPKTCGNNVCEPARGESSQTCCLDCPCDSPLVCKPNADGRNACQAKGLKM